VSIGHPLLNIGRLGAFNFVKMRKGINLKLITIGLLLFIPLAGGRREVRDELGRRVIYPYPPKRIISLAPNLTEILFAVDGGKLVVGVSDMCNYPEEVKAKPKVGGFSPSIEQVVSLAPDIVFATTAGTRMETITKLKSLGIPVFVTKPTDISSIAREIELIGTLIGKKKEGGKEAKRFQERIERIRKRLAGAKPVKVLYLIWHKPLMAPGKGTFLTDAIRIAGGESITSSLDQKLVRLSPEELARSEPEVIFLPTLTEGEMKWFKERYRFLPAVRKGRIYSLNEDLILRPGPRIVLGIEKMAKILHPEAFNKE